MEGTGFWVIAVLASVFVGLSKGGLPVVAMLSVPLLALVMPPVTAAGLLLPVYMVSDMFGLYAYRRAVNKKLLLILAPAATLGVALGWATAAQVPERLIAGAIGAIGVAFALNLLLRRQPEGPPQEPKILPGLFWGTMSGMTSFVSHSGGPPYQAYVLPLRLDKMVYAGTTTVLFAYVNAVKLLPYWALGQLSFSHLKTALVLAIPASVAVLAGVRLVRIIPQKQFFLLVTWALLAVSGKLLWSAVFFA
jgi:uncharacterized membrane protein YfcA